jgi:2'-5' RNA ligase
LSKIRTFLSLNIESSVREKAAIIQKKVMDTFRNFPVKWEDPEKYHLTVRFLGDIEESDADELAAQLEKIDFTFDKIKYFARNIGFFPNPKHPNVIFIGLEEDGDYSGELVNKINSVISGPVMQERLGGIKPDKKFVAHITMGRFRRENRKSADGMVLESFEPFNVEFNSFFLMKSVLDQKGSRYFPLKEFIFKKN